jgi:carbon monoxide dehydrogenase subunit G
MREAFCACYAANADAWWRRLMKLTNEFTVPVPAEEAWATLIDVERIVPCMPGAELVERVGDNGYKGRVSVQLGPVKLALEGIAKFVEIDEAARRARVEAQGADKRGRGGAHAKVAFQLMPDGAKSRVQVETDLQLSGSIAQYGRASGLIAEVAKELTGQFAENLGREIGRSQMSAVASQSDTEPQRTAPPAATPISGFRLAARVAWGTAARFFQRLFRRG